MAYIQDNSNPVARRVTDCAVRAVGYALGIDWETAYFLIAINGASMGDMMESNSVWGSVLRQAGYKRRELPSTCPACYTVSDFALDHPDGTYILGLSDHLGNICKRDEEEEGMDDQSRRMSGLSYGMSGDTGRSYATGGMARRGVERGRDMSYASGMDETREFERILENADDHTIKALSQALQMRK